MKLGESDSLELSRKLFRQYLAEYHEAHDAPRARLGIVRTYLTAGRLVDAVETLRGLEKSERNGTEFADELLAIAQAHVKAERPREALGFLEEMVRRFPRSATASLAYLAMGEVYAKLGDDDKMIAAYGKAVEVPRTGTHTSVMDASDTHNRAAERLGRYYMDKQDWERAMRWWRAWKPTSWCGTCAESMRSRRAENIAICLMHLDRHPEAARICLKALMERGEGPPDIAILLYRLYRDAGQLSDLRRMLRAFEKDTLGEYEAKGYLKRQTREEARRHLPTSPVWDLDRLAGLKPLNQWSRYNPDDASLMPDWLENADRMRRLTAPLPSPGKGTLPHKISK